MPIICTLMRVELVNVIDVNYIALALARGFNTNE